MELNEELLLSLPPPLWDKEVLRGADVFPAPRWVTCLTPQVLAEYPCLGVCSTSV
jgi:hypothetical protein